MLDSSKWLCFFHDFNFLSSTGLRNLMSTEGNINAERKRLIRVCLLLLFYKENVKKKGCISSVSRIRWLPQCLQESMKVSLSR